ESTSLTHPLTRMVLTSSNGCSLLIGANRRHTLIDANRRHTPQALNSVLARGGSGRRFQVPQTLINEFVLGRGNLAFSRHANDGSVLRFEFGRFTRRNVPVHGAGGG